MQAERKNHIEVAISFFLISITIIGFFLYPRFQTKKTSDMEENMSLVRKCLKNPNLWPDLTQFREFKDILTRLPKDKGQMLNKNYFFERNKTNYQLNILPITDEDRSFIQIELTSLSESGSHVVKTEQRLSFTDEDLQKWLEGGTKIQEVVETWLYAFPELTVQVVNSNSTAKKMVFSSAKDETEVECLAFDKGLDEGFGSGLNCQCLNQ